MTFHLRIAPILFAMGRRLEKNDLFCNTLFLSKFTIKFVQYVLEISDLLYTTKYTLSWNKKSLLTISYISDFLMYMYDKYTLGLNKKGSQNKSKISDLFCSLFCSYLQCICHEVLQNKWLFSKRPSTRCLEKWSLFCFSLLQIPCKLEQKSLQNTSKIYFMYFFAIYSVFEAKCNKINNIWRHRRSRGWGGPALPPIKIPSLIKNYDKIV